LETVQRAGRLVDAFLVHGARVTELVLQHSPQFGTEADDRLLAHHLRSLIPPGVEIEAEPTKWADALSMVGFRRSPTKIGRAFARLAGSRPAQLVINRPPRGDDRAWRVRRTASRDIASLVTEASVTAPQNPPRPDASDTNDTSPTDGAGPQIGRSDNGLGSDHDPERRAIIEADVRTPKVQELFDGAVRPE
jgi:hypothetical protein